MKRPVRVEGDIAYVSLTQGYEAVIDAEDVPLVEGRNWCSRIEKRKDGRVRTVYAMAKIEGQTRFMHQIILGLRPGSIKADHEDSNGLNNRKYNLRYATDTQNAANKQTRFDSESGIKGVTWFEPTKKWCARIMVRGERVPLGHFRCKTAAAMAYAKASKELHGEFGRLN